MPPEDLRGTRSAELLPAGGRPLDPATRSYFDLRFGQDFRDVRIHTGASASSSARRLGAVAYTLGSDIVFRDGAYAPQQGAGRRLLAHELAHVVQQTRGGSSSGATSGLARTAAAGSERPSDGLAVSQPEDPLEQEADRVADQVTASHASIAPTISGRAIGTLQREDEDGQQPASAEQRARAMFVWFMRGPYHRIGVDGVLRWLERSIAWGRESPPNLIAIHAIPGALAHWLAERLRDESMRDRFAGMNGITRFVAEDRVRAAHSALQMIDRRARAWGYQTPLSGGAWDHYLRIVQSARDHLLVLNGEVSTTAQLAGLERATDTSLTVGMGIAALPVLPIAVQAMAAEAPILAYTLRRSAWQAFTWAMSNPGSAIAVADFGTNTVYGMATAGGVEPFMQAIATPEGATQFMMSLMFLRNGMSGGGGSPEPARPTPTRPTQRAPTRTTLVLAAVMNGTAETTPLGGRGQLLPRPNITLSQAGEGQSATTASTARSVSATSITSATPTASATRPPANSIGMPTNSATTSGWRGAQLDIVSGDTGMHVSLAGLTPGVPASGSVHVPLPPMSGFDEPVSPGETYHTDSLPSHLNTTAWTVVGVWRNQAGQIVRIRARQIDRQNSTEAPGVVQAFIDNHPRAAARLGFRRSSVGADNFVEFPTPDTTPLPGAMPLRQRPGIGDDGTIGRSDYFNTVASGAIPLGSHGRFHWHDRSHHYVGGSFVTGPVREAMAARLRILQRLSEIAAEGNPRTGTGFITSHLTPEVDRAMEAGIQHITDALSRPTAQIDRNDLVMRLRIIAHGGGGTVTRPAYEHLLDVFSDNPSANTQGDRNTRWFANLSPDQRRRMWEVLSTHPPLLSEAALVAEANNILNLLRGLDGEPRQ